MTRRTKISHDPNNTAWTRSTTTFGHKILTSQGWAPGKLLGLQDAPHAEHHSAANESHIRVAWKDDTLGLGAKTGREEAKKQAIGLDAFQGLLERLNGKSEDAIQQQQTIRDSTRRETYVERRFGSVTFIKGGFLVGDKIQKLIDDEAERVRRSQDQDGAESEVQSKAAEVRANLKTGPKRNKSKRTKKAKADVQPAFVVQNDDGQELMQDVMGTRVDSEAIPSQQKPPKKRKKSIPASQPPDTPSSDVASSAEVERPEKEARKQHKAERRARREAKRVRREERARSRPGGGPASI